MDNSLDEIKELWEKETDNYLVKAATVDLQEYSPEIQEIIKNEVKKRGLEGTKFDKPSIPKELAEDSMIVNDYVAFLDAYVEKYSYFSKIFLPLLMFFYTFGGAIGRLMALNLRKLFYKEIETEEDIVYKKKSEQ